MIYKEIERAKTKILISSFLSWLNFFVLMLILLYIINYYFYNFIPTNSLIFFSFILSLIVYFLSSIYFYLNPTKLFPSKYLFSYQIGNISSKPAWLKILIYLYILFLISILLIPIPIFYLLLKFGLFIFLIPILFIYIFMFILIFLKILEIKDYYFLNKQKNFSILDEKFKTIINIAENLRIAFGIHNKPIKINIVDLPYINAFVLENPLEYNLFVSDEVLKLDYYKIECILAHEFAHIKNRDSYYLSKLLFFAGITVLLSDLLIRILPRLLTYGSLKN